MHRFVFFLLFPLFGMSQSLKPFVDELIVQKKFEKARDTLESILKKHPNELEALELMGDVYSNQKKWDEAIDKYERLVELNAEVANYQYKYGGALSMKALSVNKLRAIGYLDDMEKAFLKAAELDPNHLEARWALARYYMHVPGLFGGSKDKAWQYTDELLRLSPVDGYLAKGHFYEDEKEYQKAEAYYKQALQVGGSMNCYQHLVDLYLKSDQGSKALTTLKEANEKFNNEELQKQIKELEKHKT